MTCTGNNILDVFDASEIWVEIGEYDDTASEWNYTPIKFRRNVSPDFPDNTRAVYNGITYVGDKIQRGENMFTLEAEFQGFNEGLMAFEGKGCLLVKVEIKPNNGETVENEVRYYTNWNPQNPDWSAGDEGEFNVTLEGRIDVKMNKEPYDNVDWKPAFYLTTSVEGDGTLTVDPDETRFEEGTEVTLTAEETGNDIFVAFQDGEGEELSTELEYTVTMNEDKEIVAVFETA